MNDVEFPKYVIILSNIVVGMQKIMLWLAAISTSPLALIVTLAAILSKDKWVNLVAEQSVNVAYEELCRPYFYSPYFLRETVLILALILFICSGYSFLTMVLTVLAFCFCVGYYAARYLCFKKLPNLAEYLKQ